MSLGTHATYGGLRVVLIATAHAPCGHHTIGSDATRQGDSVVYAKHEDVVARNNSGQDLLWKINISVDARMEFLQKLHKMNINSFSLFATEDSLLQTLSTEIFLLSNSFIPSTSP